jgi:hypothetical protein
LSVANVIDNPPPPQKIERKNNHAFIFSVDEMAFSTSVIIGLIMLFKGMI